MPSSSDAPTFNGMHFFVRDMAAALRFYALLGFVPSRGGDHFAHIDLSQWLGAWSSAPIS
jgi:hypothetical protein